MARFEKRCPQCGTTITARRCPVCNSAPSWGFIIEAGRKDGKRKRIVRRGFATKSGAQAAASEMENDLRTRAHVEPSKISVGEWLDAWYDKNALAGHWKPSTASGYASLIRSRLKPAIGDIPVQQLSSFDLERAYTEMLASGCTAGTVRNAHSLLRGALNNAVATKLLRDNPTALASRAKVHRVERTSWTPEELATFRKGLVGHRLESLFRLIALTGMRRSEALGLRWEDVDLSKNVIHIRKTLTKGPDGATLTSTKTPRSRRSIEIDSSSAEMLGSLKTIQKAESLEFGRAAFLALNANNLVFTRRDGSPLDPDSVSKTFLRICKPLNVRRITLHELRHTHGSVLLKEGVPLHVVSQRLGHSSAEFTATVYSHVLPGQGEEAASKLAAIFDG